MSDKTEIKSVLDRREIKEAINVYAEKSGIKSYLRAEQLLLTIGIAAVFDCEIDVEDLVVKLISDPFAKSLQNPPREEDFIKEQKMKTRIHIS